MNPEYITHSEAVQAYCNLSSVAWAVRAAARKRGLRTDQDLLREPRTSSFSVELQACDMWRDLPSEVKSGPYSNVAWVMVRNAVEAG